MRNDSPGMLKQLQQKVELRKASGLDSWKAVLTPTFQLYLGPCHFTSGFCLKGETVSLCMLLYVGVNRKDTDPDCAELSDINEWLLTKQM